MNIISIIVHLILIFVSHFIGAYEETGQEVPCEIDFIGETCIISGLNLTRENYNFIPTTNNPELVLNFVIKNSKLYVLSKNICEAFPNLKTIIVKELGTIEEIKEDAFQHCTQLEMIDLDGNPITNLKKGSFSYLNKLKSVYISDAELSSINSGIFSSLTELKKLFIRRSNLTSFPAELVKNLGDLRVLSIHENNLIDLEIETILDFCPNLETIYLNGNLFSCTRLHEILSVLKRKNVEIGTFTSQKIQPPELDGISCMNLTTSNQEEISEKKNTHANSEYLKEVSEVFKEHFKEFQNKFDQKLQHFTVLNNEIIQNLQREIQELKMVVRQIQKGHEKNGL